MRWMLLAITALICISAEGPAQDATKLPLPYRCLYEKSTAKLARVDSTGDAWIDRRVRTERDHLKVIFRVDADVVLYGLDAPRKAFVTRDPSGAMTVCFKAAWLREHCRDDDDHRLARTAYALAHMYAHVLQERIGCDLPERERELHADLLAGWYLGRRNIATLKGDPPLNPTLAPLLFSRKVEYLNEELEHGTPAMRARALATGFKLWRTDRLSLGKVYRRGLDLYPPAKVGLLGADANVPGPLRAAMNFRRIKVGCRHQGPCKHKVPCTHSKPCTHKIACQHLDPCNHHSPCVHQVPCVHKQRCVHRVECTHKVQCVHTLPCVHRKHTCDYLHSCDYDQYGVPKKCVHQIPCSHFLHRCDFLHNFDYAHDFDYEHEWDPVHEFDLAHEFDTEHDGHPRHEFDWAHEWDPIHPHDLAHESDPVHDYDIELKPADGSK